MLRVYSLSGLGDDCRQSSLTALAGARLSAFAVIRLVPHALELSMLEATPASS